MPCPDVPCSPAPGVAASGARRRHLLARWALGPLCATLVALQPATSLAHGPTRQKVTEEVRIQAPAAKVWALVRDFDAIKAWHPAVADSSATQGNTVGSVRTLTLKGGGTVVETLEAHDEARMRYSYRAKQGGALPVSNYSSTLTVKPDGEQTVVEWRGAFYRGYPNNDPPPDQNDEAAVKAITGVYQTGLAQLKQLAEGR